MSESVDAPDGERRRILTGLRPSGPSHVGHYAGAFSQWLELQEEYESFFLLADYQVSDYADNLPWIRWGLWEVTLDWLGVGLDPNVSHFVIESGVPEFAELTLHLSWFLGLGHLQRNPTLKAELADLETTNKTVPVAFFNYPVMQISNILLPLAHLVPVGEDQLPHIEMTRDVAIRFNRRFGETFVLPEGRVGEVPRLVGIDGKGKMGTSAGNAIFLKDSEETLRAKVRSMFTDPNRLRATDPGTVEGNPVFMYHDAFNPDTAEVDDLKARYRTGPGGRRGGEGPAVQRDECVPGADPGAPGGLGVAAGRRAGRAGGGDGRDEAPGGAAAGASSECAGPGLSEGRSAAGA